MVYSKIVREYLNESKNNQIYYHVTPLVNILSIKTNGIKMGDGDAGKGVYLSKTLTEALTWKNIFDIENEYKNKKVYTWYVVEIVNLDDKKLTKVMNLIWVMANFIILNGFIGEIYHWKILKHFIKYNVYLEKSFCFSSRNSN